MAKKIDPKAKAKRQKIYAGVGGVILLAVLAFQVPRTLEDDAPVRRRPPRARRPRRRPARRRRRSARPRWPAATPPRRRPRPRPEATASATPTRFPPPESGQLLAFGLFRSKDPFVQQLDLNGATGSTGRASPALGTTGATARRPEAPAAAGGARCRRRSRSRLRPRRRRSRPRAVISVNGAPESVQVGRHVPDRGSVLQARLADEEGRQDLDRRRLARERRADDHADQEQAADADEHRRRHALRAAARLGLVAERRLRA